MSRNKCLETDRFIVGNCVEVLSRFPEASVDLTVTSPPYDGLRYYQGYEFDAEKIAHSLLTVTKSAS